MYIAMKVRKWNALTVNGFECRSPSEGSVGFIEVFETREQAIAEYGEDSVVLQIQEAEKEVSNAAE